MSAIRKALEGIPLPAGAEEAIAAAEKSEREDASYIDYLESQLAQSRKETPKQKSVYRREWEQARSDRSPSRLDDVKEKILLFLSENDEADAGQVARGVSIGVQAAQYHLEELVNSQMVYARWAVESPIFWSLAHEGRGYLVRHRLIT